MGCRLMYSLFCEQTDRGWAVCEVHGGNILDGIFINVSGGGSGQKSGQHYSTLYELGVGCPAV